MGNCCTIKQKKQKTSVTEQQKPVEEPLAQQDEKQNEQQIQKSKEDFDQSQIQEIQQSVVEISEQINRSSISKSIAIPFRNKIRDTVKLTKSIDEQGNKRINDYTILQILGTGTFGTVKLVYKTNILSNQKQYFALKIFKKAVLKRKREFYIDKDGKRKTKDALDDVKREIAIMKKLHHKNIIRLHEVIDNPDKNKIYMDYACPGQLIDWDEDENKWKRCNENKQEFYSELELRNTVIDSFIQLKQTTFKKLKAYCLVFISSLNIGVNHCIFRGCVEGLEYLHSQKIIHRDIKPQNLLMNENNQIQIADFGVSTIFQTSDMFKQTVGTYSFMPPETFDLETAKIGYSGKAFDIWSLGITFFSFIFMELPFFNEDQYKLKDIIQFEEEISESLKEFINGLLTKNPENRYNMDQILQNQWLNEGYEINLIDQIQNDKSMICVSDKDVNNAFSIYTIAHIKTWVAKWKNEKSERKISVQSNFSQPISQIKQFSVYPPSEQNNTVINNFIENDQDQSLNKIEIKQKTQQQ